MTKNAATSWTFILTFSVVASPLFLTGVGSGNGSKAESCIYAHCPFRVCLPQWAKPSDSALEERNQCLLLPGILLYQTKVPTFFPFPASLFSPPGPFAHPLFFPLPTISAWQLIFLPCPVLCNWYTAEPQEGNHHLTIPLPRSSQILMDYLPVNLDFNRGAPCIYWVSVIIFLL